MRNVTMQPVLRACVSVLFCIEFFEDVGDHCGGIVLRQKGLLRRFTLAAMIDADEVLGTDKMLKQVFQQGTGVKSVVLSCGSWLTVPQTTISGELPNHLCSQAPPQSTAVHRSPAAVF